VDSDIVYDLMNCAGPPIKNENKKLDMRLSFSFNEIIYLELHISFYSISQLLYCSAKQNEMAHAIRADIH
jgi:hypothetical protein